MGGRCESSTPVDSWWIQRDSASPTKNILIDYEKAGRLCGFDDYDRFQLAYRGWVQAVLADDKVKSEDRWTQNIATGSHAFVEKVKNEMRSLAIGRHVRKRANAYEL